MRHNLTLCLGKLRRERRCFSCSIQWTVIAIIVVCILMYNSFANVWVRTVPCPLIPSAVIPTCEPCVDTVPGYTEDDPLAKLDLRLGRWDNTRTYKMFDYAFVGDTYADISSNHKVTLATQSSIERLGEILRMAPYWSGAISVGVFVVGDEFKMLQSFATWLFRCQPDLYSRLALHVATPADLLGIQGPILDWARDCRARPRLAAAKHPKTTTWRAKHPYPQNHMRNLARKNCHSPFVFLLDIDIVPSMGMAEQLDDFLTRTPRCAMCAYVVTTYELDKRVESVPKSKKDLLRLSKNKLAIPFHRNVFIYNQFASNFSVWEASRGNESDKTHISHNVTNFELLYEPFYVASDSVPPHDERFLGYGFTRNTQVYEMFLRGYQFKVLSPVFTIHWGLQARKSRPVWREKQNAKNYKVFESFKRELFAKYRKDPLHLLTKAKDKKA